ncbi:MAG: protein translocase subunit SecA [Alphaproteobacteria bacterium]|nr:MAG: protein translocase subunit SecA [Alphaproteobacteria bacterium]
MKSFFSKLFGTVNDRKLRELKPRVERINLLEPKYQKMTDGELQNQTKFFKEKLTGGISNNEILEDAFATVREAATRTLGQRHYDVQLLGGLILNDGSIAEMKTGEGKTLVSTLAVYLNALSGKGVHVVTVNDYLANRDSQWMGKIYEFLGLKVGCVTPSVNEEERKIAYNADITYATNNELGFDYLRDNMKFRLEDMVQRAPNYAIIDEVDSILIDEARTPLIISGQAETSSETYKSIDKLIPALVKEDFDLDEKQRSVTLTDKGLENIENLLLQNKIMVEGGLYDISNVGILHHVNQSLRAHKLFQRDTHYIVRGGKVVIIDEFTGRAMEGRRFSDGLHQAIEARENVDVLPENQTLASVTFQNYFRQYPKLAGMTGTAITEAGEFEEIYGLQVIEVPTNEEVARKDFDDEVYRTSQERDDAVIKLIKECQEKKQPVLVGTVSIEKSENFSSQLKKKNIPHKVLNARFHEQEAGIIAEAGVPGAVTIATNMAGRGTDIQLGGNFDRRIEKLEEEIGSSSDKFEIQKEKIREEIEKNKKETKVNGGLFVIGTERHESRRIDNQLRGRSGRQGDPGSSKFFLSLQDDLMRIFGSDKLDNMLQKFGLEEGEAIIHPWVNKALEKAQQKVESRNFDIRKQLLKFDDVMNDQRQVVFEQRREIMSSDNVLETVIDMRHEVISDIVYKSIPEGSYSDKWDHKTLNSDALKLLGIEINSEKWFKEDGIAEDEISQKLKNISDDYMISRANNIGEKVFRTAEKSLLLQVLDQQWKEHLQALEQLRQSIGLRAYGQKDPLNEYKREAFILFEQMLQNLRTVITSVLSHLEVKEEKDQNVDTKNNGNYIKSNTKNTDWGKVPRNAKCPCGSGKKYKHCCGK